MKTLKDDWLVFNSEKALAKELALDILSIAKKAIIENDCFNVVLTGGRSAISLYKILSKSNSNWDKWHIYISDERFLPAGHKDRNDKEINKVWLNNSSIPNKNIHFIKAELGLLEARYEYEKEFPFESVPTKENIIERMGILNLFYLKGECEDLLYDSISPVNTFRLIFNCYFKTDYELLDDLSFYNNGPDPFVDVTKILSEKLQPN